MATAATKVRNANNSATISFSNINAGDRLSSTSYFNVLSVDRTNGSIYVEDQQGQKMTIKGKSMIEQMMSSANQYQTEQTLSRTEVVNILRNAKDRVFTVRFEKQDGNKRDLTGHLIDTENEFGRSNVIDLEIGTGQHQLRQVDHRTIEWLVINNVKYTVKSK